jgi:hypothetical protein
MSNDTQITLNDLNYFWLPNGAPCFLADNIDICEQIESLGFQIYYLIGHKGTTTNSTTSYKAGVPSTTTQNTTYKSKMFKVVNNFVGRAVSEVEEDFGPALAVFKEEAHYTMPAIPNVIVEKLDEFFRLIHAKHGSESIVLLTYDTTKEGPEGWGILVPEQTNTSTHCKYDPDSIVDLKEDHIMIVGSVHSHPEMPAYASGTDHEDQADFDGLHITYGWQKSVSNGATQYHLELQMGGTAYTLSVKDVFEDFIIQKDPDPEVIAWSEKVKKALPPQQQLAGATSGIIPINQPATPPPAYIPGGSRKLEKRSQVIPFDKNSYPGTIAAEIDISGNSSMICPSCLLALFKTEIYQGSSCPACDIPIVPMNNDIDNIIDSIDIYCMERNLSTFAPYYLWASDSEDFIMMIKPSDSRVNNEYLDKVEGLTLLNSTDDWEDESIFNEDILEKWSNVTICCGAVLNGEQTACGCEVTVLPDDVQDFDEAMSAQGLKVYDAHSVCESCEHYYFPSCPGYREQVMKFAIAAELPNQPLSGCTSWEAYKNSSDYSMKGWENYGV